MTRLPSRLAALLVPLALLGCDRATGPDADGARAELRAELLRTGATAEGGVRLENLTDEPVYYFAADREALALILWGVCEDPATCRNVVPPRATLDVPRSAIAGDQPGSHEVAVHHWLLVRRGDRWKADSIRVAIVRR
jgi:hypothetical protein